MFSKLKYNNYSIKKLLTLPIDENFRHPCCYHIVCLFILHISCGAACGGVNQGLANTVSASGSMGGRTALHHRRAKACASGVKTIGDAKINA